MIRDEFSRMRAHLFEAAEAAGWPTRQEKGWKGVIRTITYDSQSSIEASLRRAASQRNGGTMAEPGITSAHVQAAYAAEYPSHQPEDDETQTQAAAQAEEQKVEETSETP
jgi:hypothetical protein